jgi:hypothetical protein
MFLLQTLSDWLNQSAANWMPRAQCVLGNPVVISLHILSDLMIVLAYYSIPIVLWYFARKKKEFLTEYRQLFFLFGAFIMLCGTTHLFGIFMFWWPMYWTDGALKLWTGIVSLFTAIKLVKYIPRLLALPTKADIESALHDKMKAEEKADMLGNQLKVWTNAVATHIETLKLQREKLAGELNEKGINVEVPPSDSSIKNRREKIIELLKDVQNDLLTLEELNKEGDDNDSLRKPT